MSPRDSAHASWHQMLQQGLQQAWQQRSPRERLWLAAGATVLVLAWLWSVALAPAWRTWQEAPARQAQLDAQTQRMRSLQAQASSLQKSPPPPRAEALQWLNASVGELGPGANLQLQGDRATLCVEAAPAEPMARWLSQARERALALPLQAQLQQVTPASKVTAARPGSTVGPLPTTGPAPAPAAPVASDPGATVYWRGTVVLRLPGTP